MNKPTNSFSPKQDLKIGRAVEKELINATSYRFIEDTMDRIEARRKELYKTRSNTFTQEYVAEKAGISRVIYSQYVRKIKHTIPLLTLKNIADVLDCNVSDFFP